MPQAYCCYLIRMTYQAIPMTQLCRCCLVRTKPGPVSISYRTAFRKILQSQTLKIGCENIPVALKSVGRFDSTKFQSDRKNSKLCPRAFQTWRALAIRRLIGHWDVLAPEQNGRHFADLFKCIYLIERNCILIKVSRSFQMVQLTIGQHWFR